uniref:Pro-neuregulin-4, membrane-bound isoform n=1 Tax=Rhinopithecus roxellana TaxID=61622 RepID=A0A2K6Q4K5_RHIRO
MPTDHEEPCGPSHKSFCLNGGLCYMIPTIPSPFCSKQFFCLGFYCKHVFLCRRSSLFRCFVFRFSDMLFLLLIFHFYVSLLSSVRKGHFQRASSVQYDINLVETSSTSAHHSE